jgi:hypothetical protein
LGVTFSNFLRQEILMRWGSAGTKYLIIVNKMKIPFIIASALLLALELTGK